VNGEEDTGALKWKYWFAAYDEEIDHGIWERNVSDMTLTRVNAPGETGR